ncbi:hypothetical protein DdX_17029 [Ditylenchus destructor]|uniref:F-box domain-containing protein n=1 Tax=Ditylenchus destructor TaxID=166010 RepID=A0AAD4MMF8_9BILA|nr:hypothetical protein DdX_17029 [Ditylenchus destructor]
MSSLPNEIFSDMTKFLPNDDITDLMHMSRKFNALVTPRLKKIDQEMTTMNQSIKSFMASTVTDDDDEWISQLNLKRFEPIGSKAKKAMKEVFAKVDDLKCLCDGSMALGHDTLDRFKEGMSLERFDDATFLRILGALVATPKFRQEYNVPFEFADDFVLTLLFRYQNYYGRFDDVERIWTSYWANFESE